MTPPQSDAEDEDEEIPTTHPGAHVRRNIVLVTPPATDAEDETANVRPTLKSILKKRGAETHGDHRASKNVMIGPTTCTPIQNYRAKKGDLWFPLAISYRRAVQPLGCGKYDGFAEETDEYTPVSFI